MEDVASDLQPRLQSKSLDDPRAWYTGGYFDLLRDLTRAGSEREHLQVRRFYHQTDHGCDWQSHPVRYAFDDSKSWLMITEERS